MTRAEEIAAVEEGAYALLREQNYTAAMKLLAMALRWRYLDGESNEHGALVRERYLEARGSRTEPISDGKATGTGSHLRSVADGSPGPYDRASAPAEITPQSLDAWQVRCS